MLRLRDGFDALLLYFVFVFFVYIIIDVCILAYSLKIFSPKAGREGEKSQFFLAVCVLLRGGVCVIFINILVKIGISSCQNPPFWPTLHCTKRTKPPTALRVGGLSWGIKEMLGLELCKRISSSEVAERPLVAVGSRGMVELAATTDPHFIVPG